ncbi:MAG: SDR family oxidoreductase [Myxococcota bacterium]
MDNKERAGVAVTGANGVVGRAILRRALEAGLFIRAIVRSQRAVDALPTIPSPSGRVAIVEYGKPETLEAALCGAQTVIHLPGLLIERPEARYREANVLTTQRTLEAAQKLGLAKLVLVSALGADANGTNAYLRTKGEAEALVRASGMPYTILRAPLILGRGTEGSRALLRAVRSRVAWLPGGGRHRLQPLDVDDLARAALQAARVPEIALNQTLDLVGPTSLQERDLLIRLARLRRRHIRIFPVPLVLLRGLLALRVRLRGPGLSPDVLEVITADTRVDPEPAARALEITLSPLEATLRRSLGGAEAP